MVIRLSDYKITGEGGAAIGPVKAGTINFEAHNDGATEHEFVLLKNDADPASLEVVDHKIDEDTNGAGPGEVAAVAVGETKTESIDLAPGTYIYVCNLLAHYEQGMRGRLIIQ
ncbi:MAG: cupredoxin domain-containing protein [Chloroflexota bacterium]|nr:cupredoxin domain-containing protein [Chloroflexota bacterium]